jgi:hypothetical protein
MSLEQASASRRSIRDFAKAPQLSDAFKMKRREEQFLQSKSQSMRSISL